MKTLLLLLTTSLLISISAFSNGIHLGNKVIYEREIEKPQKPQKQEEREKKERQRPLSTQERAREMFREPSAEEQGKIRDKFQPIDHDIKTAPAD